MNKKILTFLSIIILTFNLSAQLLNLPESVEYDPYNNRYLVSNWGNGNIIQIDSTGTQSIWLSNVQCFAGLHRQENILYVACREAGVKGFDLLTGENVLDVDIPEAENINDIVADNSGNLYVSYPTGDVIYKVDIATGQYWIFADNDLDVPNGMYFEEENNRIILVSYRVNSPIQQISLEDSTVTLITYPGLHNLDGISRDNEGNYYVSSWQNNRVYKFESTFLDQPEIFSNHTDDPADIFFDQINNVLAVPLFFTHQIEFLDGPITGSTMDDISEFNFGELVNYPNPFNPTTTISFTLTTEDTENTELMIYNIKGQKIKDLSHEATSAVTLSGVEGSAGIYNVIWDGTDEYKQPVSSGIYFCHLELDGRIIAKKKMILLK
jgi:SMP-30/gluconolaconase/LRE-like protein/type IX secretion system substrate protein